MFMCYEFPMTYSIIVVGIGKYIIVVGFSRNKIIRKTKKLISIIVYFFLYFSSSLSCL